MTGKQQVIIDKLKQLRYVALAMVDEMDLHDWIGG
jgi:hypothetical protein